MSILFTVQFFQKDQQARVVQKWKILFDFLDLGRDGFLKKEELMASHTQLIKRGKVDSRSLLSKVSKSHWYRVCQAINLPPEQQVIGHDL